MGMGTSGVPTADNILDNPFFKHLILSRSLICLISNEYDKNKCFKKSVVGYIVGWKPEYFGCLGYIVSLGIPPVPIPMPEEIQLLMRMQKIDVK
jgi:hypothetical protein